MTNVQAINIAATVRPRRLPGLIEVAVLVLCLFAPAAFAQGTTLSESAMQQIQILMAEKASRTPVQKKIDSRLLYTLKRQRGDVLFRALPDLRTRVEVDRDGTTLVDIRAEVSDTLLVYIGRLGGTVVNSVPQYGAIRAHLPLTALETLAGYPDVSSIRTAERYMLHKNNTSEGDVAHATETVRTLFPGAIGTGVKIGVMSDSVEALEALQASGDLPPVVTVLTGQSGAGSSEGTALLEIVFDLAPGAELLFATALPSRAQFATNIADLAAAGAEVIVDDVGYFAEGVFQDGIVAQAVNAFTATGGLYFSAAGNSGNFNDGTSGVWEGDFISAPPPGGDLSGLCFGVPCDTADLGGGASLIAITKDSPSLITLKWSDPRGGSGNDYDLYMLDAAGTTIIDIGGNAQTGTQDPFEFIDSEFDDDTSNQLAIVRFSGVSRCLHLNTNRGELAGGTDGQIYGHSATDLGFGVAAVDIFTAGGGPFIGGATNPVETFSSDGPRRIILDPAGAPFDAGNFSCSGGFDRPQPFISAADGVTTDTPGFAPFFGTSAAAPHAAAVAGLMQSAGDLSPLGASSLFLGTALDIEAAGFDFDSGAGVLDGLKAVGAVSPTGSCACGLAGQACPDDLVFFFKPNNPVTPGTINQNFRACNTMFLGEGDFSGVSGFAPKFIFEDGFESGDTSSWSNTVP